MKKLLFFMAILALLTACSPETGPETNPDPVQEVSGDYQFTVSGDGTITIIGYQGGDRRLEIPAVIGGKKVTAVADAENMNADQRELAWIVTIADGVTEICDNAFNGYKNLKTVTIPASVTVLGNHLFADCPNLERIYFEGDAPETGGQVFDTALQATVYYCETADGWTNLWKGLSAKIYDDYQYEINSDGTVKITKYVGTGGDVVIPSEIEGKTVTVIEAFSFLDCSALTSVTIPEGVAEIGDNAFSYCSNLKTAVIPASATYLNHCVFSGCSNLQAVYFEGDAPRMGHYIFDYDAPVIFYYYEDRDGWTNPWCGRTALKRPAKTETPPAAASVTAAYAGVLRGENAFIDSYSGKWQGLASLQAEDMEPEYISVTDLDQDGSPEIMITLKKGEVGFGCLVLRCQDNIVYGFVFSGRSMDEIRTDGTFWVSSGAANVGICTVDFDKDTYRVDKFTYCETDSNSDMLFFVGHEKVSEDKWREAVDQWRETPYVEWVEFSESTIEMAVSLVKGE